MVSAADAPAAWWSGTVAVADGRLAYHRTGGTGPALVLSHGLGDSGLCWTRVARALEADFDVVMLDARGHGLSSRMPEGDAPDPAADIAAAIEQLDLERPIVMGHSIGGRATAAYAAAYPSRVSKVVLEDPALTPPVDRAGAEARREKFRKQAAQFATMSDADLAALGRAYHPTWSEEEFPAWRASKTQVDPRALPSFSTPWQDDIAAIAAPTLLIRGEASLGGIVTPDIAAEAERLNPGVTTVQIAGAGHNIRRENFEAYVAAVRAFLRG